MCSLLDLTAAVLQRHSCLTGMGKTTGNMGMDSVVAAAAARPRPSDDMAARIDYHGYHACSSN